MDFYDQQKQPLDLQPNFVLESLALSSGVVRWHPVKNMRSQGGHNERPEGTDPQHRGTFLEFISHQDDRPRRTTHERVRQIVMAVPLLWDVSASGASHTPAVLIY